MPDTHHYFVDEAGDLTLFDRRKRIVVGQQGVSNTFIVGALLLPDPEGLAVRLEQLRARLLADPLLASAPSMLPAAGKTARAFHARNDLPEVRLEVFRLLQQHEAKVFVAFRRKAHLVEDFRAYFEGAGRKRDIEDVYEQLLVPVFKNRLHIAPANHIVFARRGHAERTGALRRAIQVAKAQFERRWQKGIDRPTQILSAYPHEHAGLQAVDYYLWALQRFLERGESRFFEALRNHFSLIVDVDDRRKSPSGEYYSSRKPLSAECMMPVTGARSE